MDNFGNDNSRKLYSQAVGVYNSSGEVNQTFIGSQVSISGNVSQTPNQDPHPNASHTCSPSAAVVAASQIGHLEQYFINSPFFFHDSTKGSINTYYSAENSFCVNFDELLQNGSFGNHSNWSQLSSNIVMFNAKPLREGTNVFRGYQKHIFGNGRDLAIKFLRSTVHSENEISVLLKLEHHPNIVKIIDSGKSLGAVPQIFIAMEFCHQNIHEYVHENSYIFTKASSFFEQITSAVTYIHSKNIIHRDLKPSNILVSWDGNTVKVSDFGISKVIRSDGTRATVTNAYAGTEGFKAPETYQSGKVGYKSDVFSLALNGYFIFTHGRHAFGSDPDEWAVNIKRDQNRNLSLDSCFVSIDSVKRSQLEVLFQAMLAPDPNDRPTAQQVQDNMYCQVDIPLVRTEMSTCSNAEDQESSGAGSKGESSAAGNQHPSSGLEITTNAFLNCTEAEALSRINELNRHRMQLLKRYNLMEAAQVGHQIDYWNQVLKYLKQCK